MKLLRWGPPDAEKPGLIAADGSLRDLSAEIADIAPARMTAADWDRLRRLDPAALPVVAPGQRLGPPVAGVGNILCIGLNYHDHARETGIPAPPEPIVFNKHTGALTGPAGPVPLPRGSLKMDWEAELAVVIGRRAYAVREQDALAHVAGYCVANDVSERVYQMERGGQWVKGKSCPGFCPLGPWLVTPDEVPDPQSLRVWLEVNGRRMQDGTTADMIFPVAFLVSYLSRFMALLPGDVILTGTPAGTGLGHDTFLREGDRIRLGIDGLGEQDQPVTANGIGNGGAH